jgi:hypothetical protein
MTFKFVWQSNESVWVQFYETVTFGDALAATNALYSDPRSDSTKYAFWDFSTIDGFIVDSGEVDEMAAMDHAASLYMKPMKAAFIISDPNLMVLGKQYIDVIQSLGTRWQNKLFSNMLDAQQWAYA